MSVKKTYRVYAVMTASKFVGEFEAESEDEARAMGEAGDCYVSLCHQCARELDLGDVHSFDCEEA